jgi:ABC-type multidrug transport system ATPase subunit
MRDVQNANTNSGMQPELLNMETPTLIVENLTKRYKIGPNIFEEVDYEFTPGSVTVFQGPNGSGKTTMMRLLSVSAYPTEGHIRYGDLDIHQQPYAYLQHVGLVEDENPLPDHLNAVEALEWILRERNLWDEMGIDRCHEMLDHVYLDERREQLIGTYSSGMLKKTQLAAAFIAKPKVLLMDEPFRGLDTEATQQVLDLLKAHIDRKGILILATHQQQIIDALNAIVVSFPLNASVLTG